MPSVWAGTGSQITIAREVWGQPASEQATLSASTSKKWVNQSHITRFHKTRGDLEVHSSSFQPRMVIAALHYQVKQAPLLICRLCVCACVRESCPQDEEMSFSCRGQRIYNCFCLFSSSRRAVFPPKYELWFHSTSLGWGTREYHFRFKDINNLKLPEITMVTSSEVMAIAHITIVTGVKSRNYL